MKALVASDATTPNEAPSSSNVVQKNKPPTITHSLLSSGEAKHVETTPTPAIALEPNFAIIRNEASRFKIFGKNCEHGCNGCNTDSWHVAKLDRVRKNTVRKTC
jgi:hypothetical protein